MDRAQKYEVHNIIPVPDGEGWTLDTFTSVQVIADSVEQRNFANDASCIDIALVGTGKRTAFIVREGMDAIVQGEEGPEVDEELVENPTIGVAYWMLHGAGGYTAPLEFAATLIEVFNGLGRVGTWQPNCRRTRFNAGGKITGTPNQVVR